MSLIEIDDQTASQLEREGAEVGQNFVNDLNGGIVGRFAHFVTENPIHHHQHAAFLRTIAPDALRLEGVSSTEETHDEKVEVVKVSDKALIVRSAVLACQALREGQADDTAPSKIGWNYWVVARTA